MSAVVETVKDVGNAVGDVVSSVGNAVSDAGNWVGEKVVEPLANAVDNTIQAAMDDPVGTAVKIAAYSTGNPYIIAAANTGVALANGADTDDALKAGAKAVVLYEVGSAVGEYVAPEAAEYFGPENAAAASAATNAAASTAAAVAVGDDPYQALLSSGVSSAAGLISKQVPGYDSLSANQKRALNTTVAASLEGKDPSQALVNQALQVGINYVKSKDDGTNYGYEQAPNYVSETDALTNSGLTEDDGTNYGYEQAPNYVSETDKKPTEIITTPITTELPSLEQQDLPPAPEEVVAPVDTELTEGDALSPPSVTNADLAEENIVPESVERTPITQDEVDALIDSGLVEPPVPPVESSVPTAPDSGESPSEVVVTPSPENDLKPLIDSGLVEQPPSFVADYSLSTGKDPLGMQVSPPAYVFNPDGSVNYELADTQSGLGLQIPETPNLDSMGGGQGLTAPAFGKPGGTVSEEGVFYDYNPLTGNVAPRTSSAKISSGAKPAPVRQPAPIQRGSNQAKTLDDLMLMMQGAPATSDDQEELIKLVKASPYFDIRSPLNIGFFDQPNSLENKNQDQPGVVKMAEGGYMDILFPKTQLTMDEILQILEGKYHG
jgi:hypothetical protein